MSSFQDLRESRTARQAQSAAFGAGPLVPGGKFSSLSTPGESDKMMRARGIIDRMIAAGRDSDSDSDSGSGSGSGSGSVSNPPAAAAAAVDPAQAAQQTYRSDLEPAGLEVRSLPGRGRGMIATKASKPGTRILRTEAAVSALSLNRLTTTCSGCFLDLHERRRLDGAPEPEPEAAGAGVGASASAGAAVGKKDKGLDRCSGCKALRYCSRACQLADWPSHKAECTALRRMRAMYLKTYPDRAKSDGDVRWANHEAIRALARMCWRRKSEREKNGGKDGVWWKKMASLESHVSQLSEPEVMKTARQVQHLQHYLSASMPLKPGDDPDTLEPADMAQFGFDGVAQVLDFVSAFSVNSFTLSSPSLTPIGVSTSPLVALSNHSCAPNAVVVFPRGGRWMEVVAIEDIAPGDEILTSYIDITTPYASRQADLTERYRFKCCCTLCRTSQTDAAWVDPRWCVTHVGCKQEGKAAMPDLKSASSSTKLSCDACGGSFALDVATLAKLVHEAQSFLKQEESGQLDPDTFRAALPSLLSGLMGYIPPYSHPLLPILRLSIPALAPPSGPDELKTLVTYASLSYTASAKVLPPNHPIVAVVLCEWAKLLALDSDIVSPTDSMIGDQQKDPSIAVQRAKEAVSKLANTIKVLQRAVQACERGMGGDGGVTGMEMWEMLKQCQQELAMIRYRV